MKKSLIGIVSLGLMCGFLLGKELDVVKKEDIRKTLRFRDESLPNKLMVDNLFGAITIQGYRGQDLVITALKTIKARDQAKLLQAQEEVTLEITQEENTVGVFVDGPFRRRDKRGEWSETTDPGYRVQYDFVIRVPRRIRLELKTVTEGDIRVSEVEGEFLIQHVNGAINMKDVAGSGKAQTVNGEVKVIFSRNPESACGFKTVNGDLDVTFVGGLSADFQVKTFHGDVYSDYPVEFLPLKPVEAVRRNGKYVYKSNRFFGVRVGSGGPEFKMDTLNGDILIRKR